MEAVDGREQVEVWQWRNGKGAKNSWEEERCKQLQDFFVFDHAEDCNATLLVFDHAEDCKYFRSRARAGQPLNVRARTASVSASRSSGKSTR